MAEQVKYLQSHYGTVPVQRSPQWYAARKGKITASSVATLLYRDDKTCDSYIKTYGLESTFKKDSTASANPFQHREETIQEKAGGKSKSVGNVATYWGQKYEPVATTLYEYRQGTRVIDFGLIPHRTISFLGASPDGITPDGRMLEIKCPYRRKITGIPPFYYWIQVQIQMEVCDLDTCDFLECEFVEFGTLDEFIEASRSADTAVGLFIQIDTIPMDPATRTYIYPPAHVSSGSLDDLLEWEWQTKKNRQQQLHHPPHPHPRDEGEIVRTVFWKLVTYSCVRIDRDREWFEGILPDLEEAVTDIEKCRQRYTFS